jgi:hypothetical protein
VILGLNRGDLLLVVFIFGLIYVAGLLPRIAARIAGADGKDTKGAGPAEPNGE